MSRNCAGCEHVDFDDFDDDGDGENSELCQICGERFCSECDIYDLDQHLDKTFDIVYTSYGVIGWLPDLDRWGRSGWLGGRQQGINLP